MADANAWRLDLVRRCIEPYEERTQIAVLGDEVDTSRARTLWATAGEPSDNPVS